MNPDRPTSAELGPLESAALELIWEFGESSVYDVAGRLDRPLAYSTVMTTLDRLFKKGLLDRRKVDRAFIYFARFAREDWERKRAGLMLAEYLQGPQLPRELLISCLVDAVGQYDATLLDEIERKIKVKREELNR